jgi:hypothetical protein
LLFELKHLLKAAIFEYTFLNQTNMMRTKIILLFLFAANFSFAQFDDILKKTIGSKDAWIPGKSITSSINDALPTVSMLDFLNGLEPEALPDLTDMKPGYYRGNIQSYCLHAGTYGPTKGNGYLIGPLLGKNADIVESVLNKSVCTSGNKAARYTAATMGNRIRHKI